MTPPGPRATVPGPSRPGARVHGGAARPFTVLLGPDYAGKSSVLRRLADDPSWTVVSYDRGLLDTGSPLVGRVRDEFLAEALCDPGRYSPDLVLSLLQVAVVHLRDRVATAPRDTHVLVDSYYFKILAKCHLLGLRNEALFSWWRGFPQPERVLFLDVTPDLAWRRSGHGADANSLEHYGERPTAQTFQSFQTDLRRTLLTEVSHLDVTTIEPGHTIEETVRAVEAATVERVNRNPQHV
ncbi:hypothetical protein [Streptomyces sp. NPDC005438]|uniref:hypothetical protein n=1 Tax=Streptomyces sp. NPDC005438 TaxID=3156880 RepID=UPI0033A046BB